MYSHQYRRPAPPTSYNNTAIPAKPAATAAPTASTGTPSNSPTAPFPPPLAPEPEGAPPSVLVATTVVALLLVVGAVVVLLRVAVAVTVTTGTDTDADVGDDEETAEDEEEDGAAEEAPEDPAVTVTVTETVVVPGAADVGEPVVQTGGIPDVMDVLLTGKLVGRETDVPASEIDACQLFAMMRGNDSVRAERNSPTCLHASIRKDWPVALSFVLQLSVMQFTASAMKFGW